MAWRVAVLMGGVSPEHAVSIRSGATMWRGLVSLGHEVVAVVIGRDGAWNQLSDSVTPDQLPEDLLGTPLVPHVRGDALSITVALKSLGVDIVMIGLHGPGGEDGSLQGFLEVAGLPYTGPGIPCSTVAMDKLWLKRILRDMGLPTSAWIEFSEDELNPDGFDSLLAKTESWIQQAGGYPVVAKARHLGSSFGVAFIGDAAALRPGLLKVLDAGDGLFVERGIKGVEVSCGVIGHRAESIVFPAIEIVPRAGWFDYESKYQPGGSLERIPAQISATNEARVRELALAVHCLLDAEGITRTDMIVDSAGPWILETNTLPGMTATSLIPQEARAIGWTLEKLLTRLLEIGFARSTTKK